MITCLVIQPIFDRYKNLKKNTSIENIQEAISLVESVGKLKLGNNFTLKVRKVFAGTFFSKDSLNFIFDSLAESSAGLVFINSNISAIQQRNIERYLKVKVIDRTGLILEIFSERAKSFEGRLQVDLARLSYQKSRLVKSWTHLERQRGGKGFLGGPGETQIESDRRQLDSQIKNIKEKLRIVEKTRKLHRDSRKSLQFPFVTLVGYTNVGKSSLFNRLTSSSNLEKDMLFATLDASARRVSLPSSKDIIISDTVGFISNLPTQLIKSFKSSLEEVISSDLIIHVIDLSSPFASNERQEVKKILDELNINWDKTKIIEIGNKQDLLNSDSDALKNSEIGLTISAKNDVNFEELLRLIDLNLAEKLQKESIILEFCEGRKRSWLMENNLVQGERYLSHGIKLDVRWSARQKGKFLNLDRDN